MTFETQVLLFDISIEAKPNDTFFNYG